METQHNLFDLLGSDCSLESIPENIEPELVESEDKLEPVEPEDKPEPEETEDKPEDVYYQKNNSIIKSINLEDSNIKKLIFVNCLNFGKLGGDFRNIEYLEIDNCPQIKFLPYACPNLKTLIIKGGNNIKKIPETYTSLTRVTLHNLYLSYLPIEIVQNIEYLELENCQNMTSISKSFSSLFSVCIRNCGNLTNINSDISTLRHLHLENCPTLQCFPKNNYHTLIILNCPLSFRTFGIN